jgi:hypothetical protein
MQYKNRDDKRNILHYTRKPKLEISKKFSGKEV